MDIRFNCPRCNQHLSVDESGAGMTVNCPSCNDSVEIPRSETVYEVRPRKDKRGVDLISDVLPFGRLWYDGPGAGLSEGSNPSLTVYL
jgi:hypothetical protein